MKREREHTQKKDDKKRRAWRQVACFRASTARNSRRKKDILRVCVAFFCLVGGFLLLCLLVPCSRPLDAAVRPWTLFSSHFVDSLPQKKRDRPRPAGRLPAWHFFAGKKWGCVRRVAPSHKRPQKIEPIRKNTTLTGQPEDTPNRVGCARIPWCDTSTIRRHPQDRPPFFPLPLCLVGPSRRPHPPVFFLQSFVFFFFPKRKPVAHRDPAGRERTRAPHARDRRRAAPQGQGGPPSLFF
nr:hypothetical protein [Pandoravirus massiliensis]